MDSVPPDTRVPPLILQPLLENAIYHGIEPLPDGGLIRVTGAIERGMVEINITNPVPAQGGGSHEGNRIALDNIRQRLGLAFGSRAGLEAAVSGEEYRVNIHFPEAQLS